jgi:hypothetical protein
MPRPRVTIVGIMAAVVFAAIDCAAVRVAEVFAGAFLIGIGVQVGLFLWMRGRGRDRRFWAGFVATGLVAMLAYIICSRSGLRMINRWPLYLFNDVIYASLPHLPAVVSGWFLDHAYINLNSPLRVIDVVAVFEVSYGLPMLLLASVGGLLTAGIGSRHLPGPSATKASGPSIVGATDKTVKAP